MISKIKKIAILTSGGDSPGMNNAVRAIIKHSMAKGIEPYLVYEGYKGLVEDNIKPADSKEADANITRGGTYIYSARLPEFKEESVRKKAVANLTKHGINALVVIGGDGSYIGAKRLVEMGIHCIGIPGTIDNDLSSTDETIGFDTALNTVVDAIDKIRETSDSHNRCCLVEVMGHHCGDLPAFAALATGAELVITNENPLAVEKIVETVRLAVKNGKRSIIIVVAELIYGKNNYPSLQEVANKIKQETNVDSRVSVLGYIQRGGRPTAMERVRATQMGVHAVDLLSKGITGRVIGNDGQKIIDHEIMEGLAIPKKSRLEMINISNAMNIK